MIISTPHGSSRNSYIHTNDKRTNKVNLPIHHELRDKINDFVLPEKSLLFRYLSSNANIVPFLENNTDKIDWRALSGNGNATQLLEKNVY